MTGPDTGDEGRRRDGVGLRRARGGSGCGRGEIRCRETSGHEPGRRRPHRRRPHHRISGGTFGCGHLRLDRCRRRFRDRRGRFRARAVSGDRLARSGDQRSGQGRDGAPRAWGGGFDTAGSDSAGSDAARLATGGGFGGDGFRIDGGGFGRGAVGAIRWRPLGRESMERVAARRLATVPASAPVGVAAAGRAGGRGGGIVVASPGLVAAAGFGGGRGGCRRFRRPVVRSLARARFRAAGSRDRVRPTPARCPRRRRVDAACAAVRSAPCARARTPRGAFRAWNWANSRRLSPAADSTRPCALQSIPAKAVNRLRSPTVPSLDGVSPGRGCEPKSCLRAPGSSTEAPPAPRSAPRFGEHI